MNFSESLRKARTRYQRLVLDLAVLLMIARSLNLTKFLAVVNKELPDTVMQVSAILAIYFVLSEILENTRRDAGVTICKTQRDADEHLCAWIQDHKVDKAVLIQASSMTAHNLLQTILEQKKPPRQVILYIQASQAMEMRGIKYQSDYIRGAEQTLRNKFDSDISSGRLLIRYYDVYPSVRAVKLDDEVLCVGWYAWEHAWDEASLGRLSIKQKDRDRFRKLSDNTDNFRLYGQERPNVIVHSGTDEYEYLSQLFERQESNFRICHELDPNPQLNSRINGKQKLIMRESKRDDPDAIGQDSEIEFE